jgi:hypothetical protein
MKKLLITSTIFLIASFNLQASEKTIQLKEYLELDITVPAGKFARLVFPFVIDNPRLTPKFNLEINNTKGFEVSSKGQFAGQNFLLVKSLGGTNQMMLSVEGYNLTINLKTGASKTINYIFELGKKERHTLINKEIQYIREKYETQIKEEQARLDDKAIKNSLIKFAELTQDAAETISIKEDIELEIDDVEANLYLDRIDNYINKVWVLRYDLAFSEQVKIDETTFMGDGAMLEGKLNCQIDKKSASCVFATQNKKIASENNFQLLLNTNKGRFRFKF